MPSPELRCLECNRQFADLTSDQDVERCAECGKFVVATPGLQPAAMPAPSGDLAAEAEIPTVGKATPADDLPMAQPVRPATPPPTTIMPDWARRDGDSPAPSPLAPAKSADPFRPAMPSRVRGEERSNTELPSEIDKKKAKIGLALFVTFLFFLAVVAAIAVLGYTIIRGLKMRKVITQATPALLASQVQPPAFSRTSES